MRNETRQANPTRPTPLPASRRRFHPLTHQGGEAEGRVKATARGGKPALSPSKIPSPAACPEPEPDPLTYRASRRFSSRGHATPSSKPHLHPSPKPIPLHRAPHRPTGQTASTSNHHDSPQWLISTELAVVFASVRIPEARVYACPCPGWKLPLGRSESRCAKRWQVRLSLDRGSSGILTSCRGV